MITNSSISVVNPTPRIRRIWLKQNQMFGDITPSVYDGRRIMTDDRSNLLSILALTRRAATQKERARLFELAEAYSRLMRQETANSLLR